jgi:hypothetical protein
MTEQILCHAGAKNSCRASADDNLSFDALVLDNLHLGFLSFLLMI